MGHVWSRNLSLICWRCSLAYPALLTRTCSPCPAHPHLPTGYHSKWLDNMFETPAPGRLQLASLYHRSLIKVTLGHELRLSGNGWYLDTSRLESI